MHKKIITIQLKHCIQISAFLFCVCVCKAQQEVIDSLNRLIPQATSDTQRINLIIKKATAFWDISLDSCIQLDNKIVQECQSLKYNYGELNARTDLAYYLSSQGDYVTAKKHLDKAGELLKTVKDSASLSSYYDTYGSLYLSEGKADSSLLFYKKEIPFIPAGFTLRLIYTYMNIARAYTQLANFPAALIYFQKALSIAEKAGNETGQAYVYLNMGIALNEMRDYKKAEQSYLNAIKFAGKTANKGVESSASYNLCIVYIHYERYKEAYTYGMNGARLAKIIGDVETEAACLSNSAGALAQLNELNKAEKLARQAITIADSLNEPFSIAASYAAMGEILRRAGKNKEAIPFFEKSCRSVTGANMYDPVTAGNYFALSECYEKTGNFNKALEAYKTATKIDDTLKNIDNIRKATELAVSYDFKKKQELAKAVQDKKDADARRIKTQQYFIIAGLAVVVFAFIAIALIQLKNNRQKQKANLQLERQKQKVEIALSELKSTQAQLIQSEKMASLGELTAGIAHEIQNPLNFVNNFSEVSNELVDEMKEELVTGNLQLATEIADDIKQNLEKINHHGKRADAIVKGMLQHSRQTKGIKELTDINALCDEYLRLSFHGLRAKDKSFNADFKTDFDETIGKINIVPQNMGRVLVNLLNNAFYAVNEKKKTDDENYKPLVSVQTKKLNDRVEISITDNGTGIAQNIIDKIFQPFFTTKPTGQGTGLGLSLAYDIITKEHDGTLNVKNKEGGTEFIIVLPV